jgi:hypothetical protein
VLGIPRHPHRAGRGDFALMPCLSPLRRDRLFPSSDIGPVFFERSVDWLRSSYPMPCARPILYREAIFPADLGFRLLIPYPHLDDAAWFGALCRRAWERESGAVNRWPIRCLEWFLPQEPGCPGTKLARSEAVETSGWARLRRINFGHDRLDVPRLTLAAGSPPPIEPSPS